MAIEPEARPDSIEALIKKLREPPTPEELERRHAATQEMMRVRVKVADFSVVDEIRKMRDRPADVPDPEYYP